MNTRPKKRKTPSTPLAALCSPWLSFSLLHTVLFAVPLLPTTTKAQDALLLQSQTQADQKSAGCITCHTQTDAPTMHATGTVRLGCTDCHGGNPDIRSTAQPNSPEYVATKRQAHPQPKILANKTEAANPIRAYSDWL